PEGKLRGRPSPPFNHAPDRWRRTGSESAAGRAWTRRRWSISYLSTKVPVIFNPYRRVRCGSERGLRGAPPAPGRGHGSGPDERNSGLGPEDDDAAEGGGGPGGAARDARPDRPRALHLSGDRT